MEIDLENVACALCGRSDTRLVYRPTSTGRVLTANWPDGISFNIVECKQCGLVYVNPRITEKGSAKVYDSAKELAYFTKTSSARKKAFHNLVDRIPGWLGTKLTNVLDVGCGDGGLWRSPGDEVCKF